MFFKISALKILLFTALLAFTAIAALAQTGSLVRIKVHGPSLENTATKESATRDVSIYLPPGYATTPARRFPVLYLLHGIMDTDETWTRAWSRNTPGYSTIPEVMDRGIAAGKFGEMIVVMPDNRTNWFGSFYVNSSVTGNWEDFNTRELVAHIDKNYRTLADASSRGIAGHSMGGFGAIRLAMKHPDVFSAAYGMNPAILEWTGDLSNETRAVTAVTAAKTAEELLQKRDFYSIGMITVAQAFSPNPNNPPFYVDLPFKMVDGKLQPNEPAFSRWRAHSPIRMVASHRENLRKLKGLRFDSGYEDEFRFIPLVSRALSAELTVNGIDHTFEEYNGDHRNRLWGRDGRLYMEILPYFWELLAARN